MPKQTLDQFSFAKCLTGDTALVQDRELGVNSEIYFTCFKCGQTMAAKFVNEEIVVIGAPNSPIITDAKVVENQDGSFHILFSCGNSEGLNSDRTVQEEFI